MKQVKKASKSPRKKALSVKPIAVKKVVNKTAPKDIFISKISQLPKKDKFDTHFWADFFEIKCLINTDKCFSVDDFNRVYDTRDELDIVSDDFDTEVEENITDSDKIDIFALGIFAHIESRSKLFEGFYPFSVDTHNSVIKLKSRITEKNKIYIFLLLASALNYTLPYKTELTSSFEVFCLEVMKAILPAHAEVHLFGSSNSVKKDSRYKGNIWQKINKLAEDFYEPVKGKKEDFPPTSTGDGGLDFIGWINTGDSSPHIISYSGQAGCTEEWDVKQFSSSYNNWKNKISFSVEPVNLVFAPFSLRKNDGTWHRRSDIGNCVLFDRKRLLYYFNEIKLFKKLPCYNVVEEILSLKESVFNS